MSEVLWRARVNWFVLMYTGGGPASAFLRGVLAALLVAWYAAADCFVFRSDTRAVPSWWLMWGRGARSSVWKCERPARLWAVLNRGWVCALIWLGLVLVVGFMLAVLGGCAAGRGPGGEIVVGFDVASLPETAGQGIASAARWLPEPWQSIGIGIGTLVGGGAVAAVGRRLAHSERDRADATWDEATYRAGSGGVVGASRERFGTVGGGGSGDGAGV